MQERATERDLVAKFKAAKEAREKIELELKTASKIEDAAEAALIELLEANNAVATAKYDGLGYAKMMKPKLYAHCNKEYQEELFKFLKKEKREDLIKEVVNAGSLSTFVSERLEMGAAVPDIISYHIKTSIQIYGA